MADISAELNSIKHAIYGGEVRDSIHDAIEKINDDVDGFVRGELDTTLTSTILPAQGKAVGDAIEQDVVTKSNLVPFPYKEQAVVSAGVNFTTDHRNIHIHGTPTGMATLQIFGSWGASDNIQGARFVPGATYFNVNKDELFKIVFFDSSGSLLRFIHGSVNTFTVPATAAGVNLYYQFSGAGSYVNKYFLPFIIDEATYKKEIEGEYDFAIPAITEYDGSRIIETFLSGRKKETDISFNTIIERLYESDGVTLKATRTTNIVGSVLYTELVAAN